MSIGGAELEILPLTILHKQQSQFIHPSVLLLGTLDDSPSCHGLLSYKYTIFMELLLVIYGKLWTLAKIHLAFQFINRNPKEENLFKC